MLKGHLIIALLLLKESHHSLTPSFSETYVTAETPIQTRVHVFYQEDDFVELSVRRA